MKLLQGSGISIKKIFYMPKLGEMYADAFINYYRDPFLFRTERDEGKDPQVFITEAKHHHWIRIDFLLFVVTLRLEGDWVKTPPPISFEERMFRFFKNSFILSSTKFDGSALFSDKENVQ